MRQQISLFLYRMLVKRLESSPVYKVDEQGETAFDQAFHEREETALVPTVDHEIKMVHFQKADERAESVPVQKIDAWVMKVPVLGAYDKVNPCLAKMGDE